MGRLLDRIWAFFRVRESILTRFRISFTAVILILLLPAIISIVTMMQYGGIYHEVVERVGQVSQMRPLISETIPNELFMIVAGKTKFEDSEVQGHLDTFNSALDAMMREHNAEGQKELLIARRTMDTLQEYVDRLVAMSRAEAPIAEQEAELDEIRAVASLVDDMLSDYVTVRVNIALDTSSQLQNTLRGLLIFEVALLVLALLILVLAQNSLAKSIRRPIAQLETLAANLADGNLQARAQQTSTVELIPLSNSLNVMADRLEVLIAENKREQINLKKSEMRTLQAQIAPHFLYNTLDAIIWLAQTGRSDEVVRITKSLSRFFRVSLSQGRDWITIEEEVSHLEAYLTIQQIRYRDILRYTVDIDPALYPLDILKLTLQPLVENAIYHGIKHRREGGSVTVTGRRDGDRLYFSVRDTGIGMTPERLETVRAVLSNRTSPDEDDGGFGLYNVNQRIQLYYGQTEGLQIESGDGGTNVSFSVPLREDRDA